MKTIKIGDDPSVYATGNDNCKTSTTGTSDQKPKELDWEKEFDKKFGDEYMDYDYGIKFSQITLSKNIKDFISKTLQQQRKDLIKETKIDLEDEYDNGFEDGVEQANKHQEKENVVPMANYFNHISPQDLEEIMEWLEDNDYLSNEGRLFKTQFWKLFIRQTK